MTQTRTTRRPRTVPRVAARERISPRPTDAAIAERAYERFLFRGQEHGKDLDDWLEAERELSGHQRR